MIILLLAAMGKELRLLIPHLESYSENSIDGLTVYEGRMGGNQVILAQCGIGKVNSALVTKSLIRHYQPDLIINSGVAGSTDETMKIGSVLIADRAAYHDLWCGPGTNYGHADGCPLFFKPWTPGLETLNEISRKENQNIRFGLICSGDKFISTPEEVKEIKSHFEDCLGCDMESASIAQTCFFEKVPFLVIRVMSDMPGGGENISEYNNFWEDAPKRTFNIVKQLIESL